VEEGESPQPINSLRNLQAPIEHAVSVRGVITLTSPQLYVQDVTGGVAVADAPVSTLGIGDEVEVTGFVEARPFSKMLRHADVRLLLGRTPVPPLSITAAQAATGGFEGQFVETQGHLERKQYESNNTVVLDIDDGSQSFRAIVKGGPSEALYRRFSEQSVLRLRGICVLDPRYTHNEVPFALLLRSADDIDVLVGPPWWSVRRFVELACLSLLLLLLILFFYIRIENWRLRGILEERERLALEMHDTLAQSFAGVGYQLQGIRNGLHNGGPASWPTINKQLDRACEMVRQTHEEASLSIAMLKPGSPELGDISLAFERCALRLVEGGTVKVTVTNEGAVRGLPLRVTDTLFHIGSEAITNAVRHAQTEIIEVHIAYEPDAVTLRVRDRGVGFIAGARGRGHGLQGMLQRGKGISAEVIIHSLPGEGTCIEVIAPIRSNNAISELVKHSKDYVIRKFAHPGQ
jgi:hypothetical protein